jgi:hypothetical protein
MQPVPVICAAWRALLVWKQLASISLRFAHLHAGLIASLLEASRVFRIRLVHTQILPDAFVIVPFSASFEQ